MSFFLVSPISSWHYSIEFVGDFLDFVRDVFDVFSEGHFAIDLYSEVLDGFFICILSPFSVRVMSSVFLRLLNMMASDLDGDSSNRLFWSQLSIRVHDVLYLLREPGHYSPESAYFPRSIFAKCSLP